MSDFQHDNASLRAGASLAGPPLSQIAGHEMMEPFNPEQFTDHEMPMLIWLRGDEEICGEFNMDAESVMVELGIKRSRLTQIAGKELRVGRYVRPVFRTEDVLAYKNWVRASASHLKSSRAIEDAAAKLEHETSTLADKVKDAASAELEAINDQMLSLHQISQRLFSELSLAVANSIEASNQQSERLEFARKSREKELIESIAGFIQQSQIQNSVLHTALAGIAGALQSQRVELHDLSALVNCQQQKMIDAELAAAARLKSESEPNLRIARRDAAKARRGLAKKDHLSQSNFNCSPTKKLRSRRRATAN